MSEPVILCCERGDLRWLELLKQHLAPYCERGLLTTWDPGDVPPGGHIAAALRAAYERARAVVLLVSPQFLAEFAADRDLRGPIERTAARGAPVLWIPLSYSAYRSSALGELRPLCDPELPLDAMTPAERSRTMVAICEAMVASLARDEAPPLPPSPVHPASVAGAPSPEPPPKPPGASPPDEALAELRAAVARILRAHPGFALDLAATLPGAAELVDRILGTPAVTLTESLEGLLERHRAPVWELFRRVLPHAADWRGELARARAAIRQGKNSIELALRTATVAELVLSGAVGRPSEFAPDRSIPDGIHHVRMPAVAHAPLLQANRDLLVDAFTLNVIASGGDNCHLWPRLRAELPRINELRAAINRSLRDHYMLYIDVDLNADETRTRDDLDAAWVVLCETFGQKLPRLRLVRLRGGESEFDAEYPIADVARKIRDKL